MLNVRRTKQTAVLLLIISLLALFTAIDSLADPVVYGDALDGGVLFNAMMPGTIAQDLVAVLGAGILGALAVALLRAQKLSLMIAALGLCGFFLYGYGTYVISAAYTIWYILYMAIFSLSIFALILGFSALDGAQTAKLTLPLWLRIATGAFLLVIVALFSAMWGSSVLVSSAANEIPDFYAVYILDLCFVMPVLLLAAILLFRGKGFGVLLSGVALLKTVTLILSVSVAGLFVPLYGGLDDGMSPMYLAITVVSAALYVLHCLKIKQKD